MAIGTPITAPVDGTNVREVDPISRIEGHLGVKLATSGGVVTEADVHGNLWRGFENFLLGRDVNDAITFTQRICGVCPVPHGMTSTYAADSVLGYSRSHITFSDANEGGSGYGVPVKAMYIRNLVLAAEFLMSSITHFYHLAAPSYVQGPAIPPWTPYFATDYYHALLVSEGHGNNGGVGTQGVAPEATAFGTTGAAFSKDLWSTVIRSYVTALRVRRLTFEAGALFAGRMPMTSCYIGGGVTFSGTESLAARCSKFKEIMTEVGDFIVKEYVPIALALGYLYQNFDSQATGTGYGAGLGNFLAWGAFPQANDSLTLPGGVRLNGATSNVFTAANRTQVEAEFINSATNGVAANLTESIAESRYDIYPADSAAYTADGGNAAYPGAVSRTKPNRSNGYSYMKAPRWGGAAMEVGPLARLVVGNYYPVDGSGLATFGSLSAHYLKYAVAFDASVTVAPAGAIGPIDLGNGLGSRVYGINPNMVNPDIAVALVRSSVATVYLKDGTTGYTEDQILANYADAVVCGTMAGWILNLKGGLSTMDRLRARALESLVLVQAMIGAYTPQTSSGNSASWGTGWIDSLSTAGGGTFNNKTIPTGTVSGWGATEAPRGALMHQVTIAAGKIQKYQCIVPTTWNGSPKDAAGERGAMEQAMMGIPYESYGANFIDQSGATQTTQGGVEALRVAQSFDPCIACAVH